MGKIKHRGEYGTANVAEMRENAMTILGMVGFHNLHDCANDLLALDELCQKLLKALKSGEAEDRASAVFAAGEFYDR